MAGEAPFASLIELDFFIYKKKLMVLVGFFVDDQASFVSLMCTGQAREG